FPWVKRSIISKIVSNLVALCGDNLEGTVHGRFTHFEGSDYCAKVGAHLVTIRDAQEANYVDCEHCTRYCCGVKGLKGFAVNHIGTQEILTKAYLITVKARKRFSYATKMAQQKGLLSFICIKSDE
ncbi:C-type lectin/C-type lectin-like domain-containing protein, partial [Loa loa]